MRFTRPRIVAAMGPPVRANSAPMRQNAEVEYFGKGNSMETAGNGPSKARWRQAAAVFGIAAAAACIAAAGLVFSSLRLFRLALPCLQGLILRSIWLPGNAFANRGIGVFLTRNLV